MLANALFDPDRDDLTRAEDFILNVALVTTGILQIRWTDDGDRDVAALATMYIAEVPNEPSISQTVLPPNVLEAWQRSRTPTG